MNQMDVKPSALFYICDMNGVQRVQEPKKKRYVVLDALRGFAILGICLANFPEFSLWTFAPDSLHTAQDSLVQALVTFFVDGKFYTLFSLLFGMGFSIQLENAGQSAKTFYRRMFFLLLIGLAHLLFLWSGDILMLYAAMGMLLPLFKKLPMRGIVTAAIVILLLPVLSEAVLGSRLADPLEAAQWRICGLYGITESNFATWLRDAHSYREVFQFLKQGAVERMWEFVIGRRYFKVLGLFLLGYAAGREKLFADIDRHRGLLRKIFIIGLAVGLPLAFLYTLSVMGGKPWGSLVHSVLYLSIYPLGLAYASGFTLLFYRKPQGSLWKVFSGAGRMACTNYLFQSVFGILIFYGIGFGLGAGVSLLQTEFIALGVYLFQTMFSNIWLKFFRFGPVEWVWRMLTYGKVLPLLQVK